MYSQINKNIENWQWHRSSWSEI